MPDLVAPKDLFNLHFAPPLPRDDGRTDVHGHEWRLITTQLHQVKSLPTWRSSLALF